MGSGKVCVFYITTRDKLGLGKIRRTRTGQSRDVKGLECSGRNALLG